MILTKAQVLNFRSIEDSGTVEIDPKITSFVGQNESGKTAFLHALHKAKSTEEGIGFDVTEDYPRKDLLDYEEVHEASPAVVVKLWYEMEPQEVETVNAWLGHDLFETISFSVDHKYNDSRSIGFHPPERQHVKWLTGSVALSSDAKAAVQAATTLDEFFNLAQGADLTPADEVTISELEAKYPE
ncbi:MAG: AAA family ATPase, partial [Bacteroidota bacterium]